MKWVLMVFVGCQMQTLDVEFEDVRQCRIAGARAQSMMRSAPDQPFSWACVEGDLPDDE